MRWTLLAPQNYFGGTGTNAQQPQNRNSISSFRSGSTPNTGQSRRLSAAPAAPRRIAAISGTSSSTQDRKLTLGPYPGSIKTRPKHESKKSLTFPKQHDYFQPKNQPESQWRHTYTWPEKKFYPRKWNEDRNEDTTALRKNDEWAFTCCQTSHGEILFSF